MPVKRSPLADPVTADLTSRPFATDRLCMVYLNATLADAEASPDSLPWSAPSLDPCRTPAVGSRDSRRLDRGRRLNQDRRVAVACYLAYRVCVEKPVVCLVIVVVLAGCAQGGPDPTATTVTETVTETVTASAPAAATVTATETVTAESETEPEPEAAASDSSEETVVGVELGEAMKFPSAVITLNAVEQVDSITSDTGTATLRPDDGESLWLLSMEWTNTSSEAVSKVCHGPYAVQMEVYDTQDRQMLRDDESGFIPGNECSEGLLTGQSGEWFSAYLGLDDADIGYVAFYEGDTPEVVILDDSVELTYTED